MSSIFRRLQEDPVFIASDAAYMAIDDEGVIRAANPRYLAATGRALDDLIGVAWYDAFPDNPDDPGADGVARVCASFEVVFREARRDPMALQRYDVRRPGADADDFEVRLWHPVNSPLLDDHGGVAGVLNHVEDVTPVVGPILAGSGESPSPAHTDAEWQALVGALVAEMLAHRQTRTRAEQLQHALSSRIVIEQAKGYLMAKQGCSPTEAFELLRRAARSSNRRLHDVAARVVGHPAPAES